MALDSWSSCLFRLEYLVLSARAAVFSPRHCNPCNDFDLRVEVLRDLQSFTISVGRKETGHCVVGRAHSAWSLTNVDAAALPLDRRSQLRSTAPGNEDVRPFVDKLLRRRKANAASERF
jgi:hypothetical protein